MNKKVAYLIFTLLLIIIPLPVLAKQNITLQVDKTDLEVGEEITVRAVVPESLDSYAFMATLQYDTNVFKKINDTNFSLASSSSITYNAQNNKFGIINRPGKITDTFFTIHLKVKENANVGYTNIALTNISSSTGHNKEIFPSTSIKVLVTRDAKEGEEIPNNKENEIKENKEENISAFLPHPLS